MEIIDKLNEKKSKLFFIDLEHNGMYNEIVDYIYQIAANANENYDVTILHEKEDYSIPSYTNKYDDLKHLSFKKLQDKGVTISAADFIFVIEHYLDVVKQLKENKIPAEIVLISANYAGIFPSLNLGESWKTYNIRNVIVPNQEMKDFCNDYFYGINYHIFPSIVDYEECNEKVYPNPTVTIFSGNVKKAEDLVKAFFLKYHQYAFIPIRIIDLSDINHIYKQLNESSLFIILDDEMPNYDMVKMALSQGTNVMGIVPKMAPQWMLNEQGLKYGIWTYNFYRLVHLLGNYIDSWILDAFNEQDIIQVENDEQKDFVPNLIENRIEYITQKINEKK